MCFFKCRIMCLLCSWSHNWRLTCNECKRYFAQSLKVLFLCSVCLLSAATVAHCHSSHGDDPPKGCQPEGSAPVPEATLHLLPCSHTQALHREPLQRSSSRHLVAPRTHPEEAAHRSRRLQDVFRRGSGQAALLHSDRGGCGLLQEDAARENHHWPGPVGVLQRGLAQVSERWT